MASSKPTNQDRFAAVSERMALFLSDLIEQKKLDGMNVLRAENLIFWHKRIIEDTPICAAQTSQPA